jgi:hypothetical protein
MLILFYQILLIAIFNHQIYSNSCSLTENANQIVSYPCISKTQNILACMPPPEQELWIQAFNANLDINSCFDCTVFNATSLYNIYKEDINHLTTSTSANFTILRQSLSCLKGYTDQIDGDFDFVKNIDNEISNFLNNQKLYSVCYRNFLTEFYNHNIQRRNLLCGSKDFMDTMTLESDNQGNINQFRFPFEIADAYIKTFVDFFYCRATFYDDLLVTVDKLIAEISISPNCHNPKYAIDDEEGVELGSDVDQYITNLISYSSKFTRLISELVTIKDAKKFRCEQDNFGRILFNINLTSMIDNSTVSDIYDISRNNITCDTFTDFIYEIGESKVSCQGECPDGYKTQSFSFMDGFVASDYYKIFIGCVNGANILFGTFKKSEKLSIEFRYRRGSEHFDLMSRCMNKQLSCLPSQTRSVNTKDGICPIDKLETKCTQDLDASCHNLMEIINTAVAKSNVVLPDACKDVMSNSKALVNTTSSDAVEQCIEFITNNFLDGLNISKTNLPLIDYLLTANITSVTSMRILQDNLFLINQTMDNVFPKVVLVASDLNVNDITDEAAAGQISLTYSASANFMLNSYMILIVILLLLN